VLINERQLTESADRSVRRRRRTAAAAPPLSPPNPPACKTNDCCLPPLPTNIPNFSQLKFAKRTYFVEAFQINAIEGNYFEAIIATNYL